MEVRGVGVQLVGGLGWGCEREDEERGGEGSVDGAHGGQGMGDGADAQLRVG